MTNDYDCSTCDGTHATTRDDDGYVLANCPKRGTILVETPAGGV